MTAEIEAATITVLIVLPLLATGYMIRFIQDKISQDPEVEEE